MKKEELLTIAKFTTLFVNHTKMKRSKVLDMIEKGIIKSVVVEKQRMIPFWDMTTTLNEIKKNKTKMAAEITEELLQEQNDEPEGNPDEPEVGSPLKPINWAKYTDEISYQRLTKALNDGVFEGVDKGTFYTENFGRGQKSSWELEWPGIVLADKIGLLIMRGGRNPIMVGKAISNLLFKHNYNSGSGKPPIDETPPLDDIDESQTPEPEEPKEIMATKKEFDALKELVKTKIENLERKGKKTYSYVKQLQLTVGGMVTSKSTGSDWDDI